MKKDKIQHFIVGTILSLLTIKLTLISVLLITFPIFIGKEIYDVYKPIPTGFDWLDILADYIGLFFGYLILFIII